jgi:hypothetical protein
MKYGYQSKSSLNAKPSLEFFCYGDQDTENAIRTEPSMLGRGIQRTTQACQMAGITASVTKKHAICMIRLPTNYAKRQFLPY